METVKVYRMERFDGAGAFAAMSWDAYEEFSRLHNINGLENPDAFPTPWIDWDLQADPNWDELAEHGSGVIFGCCHADTLREWFPPHTLGLLDEHDIKLTVWEVPADAVARSDRQAAFLRDKAELLERCPASALYEPEAQLDLNLAA